MPWTSYAGIEVIDSQVSPVRHPRWGYERPVSLKGGSLLMLADETLLVVCDTCGYNGLTANAPYVKPEGEYKPIMNQADSVQAHMSGTHLLKAPRHPMYTDDQIKVAIKVFLKWRGSRIKNWTLSAANELESMGFKPYRGEHWTPGSLGSLARHYMLQPKFKNIKAATMSEAEQKALAEMVREAAASSNGDLAQTARITESKKTTHKHTPIDFEKIISQRGAPEVEQDDKQETNVPVANNPTLNFVGRGEPASTKTMTIEPEQRQPRPAPTYVNPAPAPMEAVSLGYEHIVELPDGVPMFKYKGILMAGRPIKGVEF